MIQILGLLGMYFDAVVVEVEVVSGHTVMEMDLFIHVNLSIDKYSEGTLAQHAQKIASKLEI